MDERTSVNDIDSLRKALLFSRNTILEYEDVVKQLTNAPNQSGVVLKLISKEERKKIRNQINWLKFKTGSLVRIKRKSKFAYQHNGMGKIIDIGDKKGWVLVNFVDPSYKAMYRIGHPAIEKGECDLRLVDNKGNDIQEKELDAALISLNGAIFLVEPPQDL